MISKVATPVAALLVSIGLVVSVFMITNTVKTIFQKQAALVEQKLRNEAVDQCDKIATATYRDSKDGSTITEPFKPTYVACLKDKGYDSKISL